MKILNTRFKRIIFRITIIIFILIVLIIGFISPITKYLIEKYDVKYTGREITIDWLYINPFTGYIYLNDLKVYEFKSDKLFLYTKSITVNLEMHKLLSKTYEVSDFTMEQPIINIIQNKKEFNFNDIIEKFASKDSLPKKPNKEPVHFNFLNVKITDGIFAYHEQTVPVNYFIKNVNIESSGKKWNVDTIAVKFALASGIGTGDLKGRITVNTLSSDYKLETIINKFDLSVLEQYLKDIANYGKLRANLDANIKASGNFKNSQQLNATGLLAVNDFHFGKSKSEDFASFKKFTLAIKQLSPANKKYMFDSVSLVHPYFKYEKYDYLDNLQNMFGKGGQKTKEAKGAHQEVNILFQIADYVKLLAKNFFRSNYKIQRLGIYNADLRYNDYALTEKFAVAVTPLTITADSIDRTTNNWVDLKLRTHLKPYGDVSLNLNINPRDSSDFNLKLHIQKVPVAMFNPYLISYTSFPLDRGTIEVIVNWKVTNGMINSSNHLLVIDPRVNKRQKRNGVKWIPLKLIMFFVRERGNVIDYEIPISGNLKDPKFRLHDVITDVLKNIFVKPATTPYRYEVKNIENNIEKSLSIRWDMRSSELQKSQRKFLEKIAENLKENPEISINVHSNWYTEKEKEYILFFEAKKKYYMHIHNIKSSELDVRDTIAIDRISVKDSTFINYLNNRGGKGLFTVQDKCTKLIGSDNVNLKFTQLINQRRKNFMTYFETPEIKSRVKMRGNINKVPFNGFSIYSIDYIGGIPEDLMEDYEKINDLDNKSPRSKFKLFRKKYRKELRNK